MVPFELIVERSAANPEYTRGKLFVSANARQGHANELFFNRVKRRAESNRADGLRAVLGDRRRFSYPFRNEFGCELFSIDHQHCRLNHVFKFAYVARPRIVSE